MSDNTKTNNKPSAPAKPVVEVAKKATVEVPTKNINEATKPVEIAVDVKPSMPKPVIEEVKAVETEPVVNKEEVNEKIAAREKEKLEEAARANLKIGMQVKLKESTKMTMNGMEIPNFAYRNTYKIRNIIPSRIVIAAGTYTLAVHAVDLIVVS